MLTRRKLGRQGLEVSELGLGCMGMSQSYGTPIHAQEREAVQGFRYAPDFLRETSSNAATPRG